MDFLLQNKEKKYRFCCSVVCPNWSKNDACIVGVDPFSQFSLHLSFPAVPLSHSPFLCLCFYLICERSFLWLSPWRLLFGYELEGPISGFHPRNGSEQFQKCKGGDVAVGLIPFFDVKFSRICRSRLPAAVEFYCICKSLCTCIWYRKLQMWILKYLIFSRQYGKPVTHYCSKVRWVF